jgi:hypothetical protein
MGMSGQRHALAALCHRERTPGTHCTGGWVGLRAGLESEVRGKILCPCRGSNPDRPVFQSVVTHCTGWATPAPTCNGGGHNLTEYTDRQVCEHFPDVCNTLIMPFTWRRHGIVSEKMALLRRVSMRREFCAHLTQQAGLWRASTGATLAITVRHWFSVPRSKLSFTRCHWNVFLSMYQQKTQNVMAVLNYGN